MPEGVTEKPAGSSSSSGGVTSGTASEAMIKAAEAVSSTAPASPGPAAGETPAIPAGASDSGATSGATGQPGAVDPKPAAVAGGTQGETPERRIEAAVRNARAQVEQQYAWAKGIKPEEVRDIRSALDLLTDLRRDPRAFLQQLGAELGQRAPAVDPTEFKLPDADYTDPEGKAKFYSAETLGKALSSLRESLRAEFNNGIKPFREEREQAQTREQTRQGAATIIESARQLEHFKEHEPQINEALTNMDPQMKANLGPRGALMFAYQQVLQTVVLPSLTSSIEAKVRESYSKKAAASSGMAHPNGAGEATGGAKVTLNGPDQLARHMERMAAQAT